MHKGKTLKKIILVILCLQLIISGLIINDRVYASDQVNQDVVQAEKKPSLPDDVLQDTVADENNYSESGDVSNPMPDPSSSISSGQKKTDSETNNETNNKDSESEKPGSESKDTEKTQNNAKENADKDSVKKDKSNQKETGNEKNNNSRKKIIAKTINIPVQKKWVGPSLDAVTVRLYADGKQKDCAVLTESNGWKHSFSSLPVHDSCDGHPIVYIVKEDTPANYFPSYHYDKCNGYIITNYNREKTDIKVSKYWVGPSADSVTVKLLADNHILFVKYLTAENNWHHTFKNLPKYSMIDGHKINYDIKEISVDGYVQQYSSSEEDGFIITNISTETINIPVEKKWIGDEKESVTVRLLADGLEVDKITLDSESDWKHTFAELPKYDVSDGHEYKYLIEEDPMDNYKSEISGTVTEGFIITNTIIDPDPETPINNDDPEDPVNPEDPQDNEGTDNPDSPKPPEDSKNPEKPGKSQENEKTNKTTPTRSSQKTRVTSKTKTAVKSKAVPKTGDDNNMGLWLILSLASGGMLLSLVLKRRMK